MGGSGKRSLPMVGPWIAGAATETDVTAYLEGACCELDVAVEDGADGQSSVTGFRTGHAWRRRQRIFVRADMDIDGDGTGLFGRTREQTTAQTTRTGRQAMNVNRLATNHI